MRSCMFVVVQQRTDALLYVCSGAAIVIEENLYHGRTERCDTFDNPPLNGVQDFTIGLLEVYGFVS